MTVLTTLLAVATASLASPVIKSDAPSKAKKVECLLIVGLSKRTFEHGKPIIPRIEYRNQTDRDLTIWSCGFGPNHRVVVKDEAGASPPLTSAGKRCRDDFDQRVDRARNQPIVIPPRATYTAPGEIDVAGLYELEADAPYTLEITYDDPLEPTPLTLTSEAVPFRVVEPAGMQMPPDVSMIKGRASDCLLTVTLPKTTFKLGEEIAATIEYKNQSNRNLTIWSCGFCPNHWIVVKDAAGKSAPLTWTGKQCRHRFLQGLSRDKNVPIIIEPGKTWSMRGSIDVAKHFQFVSGEQYTLEIIYDDASRPPPLTMISQPVAFKVVQPDDAARPKSPECLLLVRLPKPSYSRGEEITPEIVYRNQGGRDLTIWSCGFCTNHKIVVKDEAGEPPPLTAAGVQCRDAFAPAGVRDAKYPVLIDRGTDRGWSSIDVACLYELQSGRTYTLEVVYDDAYDPTPLKITSAPVAFKVE